MIAKESIQQVQDSVDIVDVISDYTILKPSGKQYMGLCPFHEEKTPSFSVSPEKGVYHCFGCGASGNVYQFLMTLNNTSFVDVVEQLANRISVSLNYDNYQNQTQYNKHHHHLSLLKELLSITHQFYQSQLNRDITNYLYNERKLTKETVERWGIGYAPDSWSRLKDHLHNKGFEDDDGIKVGVLKQADNGSVYDYFRNRIIIPIHNRKGELVGFGGRSVDEETKPKYLNSPQTKLFDKSKLVFGLDKAQKGIRDDDRVIIVEGYMDVISIHQAGITNAVACMGTALNEYHVKLLSRYTPSKNIILNFDNDTAGNNAIKSTLDKIETLTYSEQLYPYVLTIQDYKDVDEFLQENNKDSYLELLNKSVFWIDWLINNIISSKDLQQGDDVKKVSEQFKQLLSKIVEEPLKVFYRNKCANLLAQGNTTAKKDYLSSLHTKSNNVKLKSGKKIEIKSSSSFYTQEHLLDEAEQIILQLYIHNESLRNVIKLAEMRFLNPFYQWIWNTILFLESQNEPNIYRALEIELLQYGDSAYMDKFISLYNSSEINKPNLALKTAMLQIQVYYIKKQRDTCLDRYLESDDDAYLNQYYQLNNKLTQIAEIKTVKLTDLINP